MLNINQELGKLTLDLVNISSVSKDEKSIADSIEEALKKCNHLKLTRVNNSLVAQTSFGNKQRENLIKHNYPKLLKKHPTYSKLIKSFIKKNPLKNLQKTFAFFQENSILMEFLHQ